MTVEDIGNRLAQTGLPVGYHDLKADTPLPAIIYYVSFQNNFAADDVMYAHSDHIIIELYTARRDPATEAIVETALADLFWTKELYYLDTEKCWEITYELEV